MGAPRQAELLLQRLPRYVGRDGVTRHGRDGDCVGDEYLTSRLCDPWCSFDSRIGGGGDAWTRAFGKQQPSARFLDCLNGQRRERPTECAYSSVS